MDTHGIHRRQPHSALRKKRFQPARLPGLHDFGVEKAGSSKPVDRRTLEERQLSGIPELPGFTIPLSDIFPPALPTQSSTTETSATPTPSTASSQEISTTSSTSSTTSSSTTSTTPTTTSTTQAQTPTTTSTPTTSTSRVVVTEVDNETAVLTSFFGQSSSTAAPSSTTLSSNDGGDDSNTGPIVGGIVAGVIALAVVVIALVWWIRRRSREKLENDITPFNPHDFRRSAFLINDEPSDDAGSGSASLNRGPTFNRGGFGGDDPMSAHPSVLGGTPRPPSMIERKLAQTPANGGYDGSFSSPYPSSSHGHGEQYQQFNNGAPQMTAHAHAMPLHYNYDGSASGEGGYGYGAGVGAGPPYGFNQFQVYGEHPHYSGVPFERYGPEQGTNEPQNPFGQSADPNLQNPFTTPSQNQALQLQSPFSPPPSSAHEVVTEDAEHLANAGSGTAVLAQVGGAAVLTRSVSVKSKHSKSNLSISIPKSIPVNATAVNGSAVSANEQDQKNAVDYPALKRQGSSSSVSTSRSGSSKKGNGVRAPPPALPIKEEEMPPSGDYVDLARSSVSPFQAAQYAEISKRLNTDVPRGLPNTLVDEYVTTRDRDLPPLPPPGQGSAAEGHRTSAISNTDSSGSSITAPNMMLDFPIPPPSPLAVTSRHSVGQSSLASESHFAPKFRIDSLPPQLPEITIGSSSSSPSSNRTNHDSFLNPPPGMSIMMSMGLNSAKDSPIYPSGITAGASPLLGKFPVTPSPLGMSFEFETQTPKVPELRQGVFGKHQEEAQVKKEQPEVKQSKGKEKVRPVTVYDEADAYGGI